MATRTADSWRTLARRAVRIARQRDLGGKALLLGAGALGGALLAVWRGAPRPDPAPVPGPPGGRGAGSGAALVRLTVSEHRLLRGRLGVGEVAWTACAVGLLRHEWVGARGARVPVVLRED